jgi:hypothetical protein
MTAKGATLASIYQAKKSGKGETKVEVLKQQFQNQIERRRIITHHDQPNNNATNSGHSILNRYVVSLKNTRGFLTRLYMTAILKTTIQNIILFARILCTRSFFNANLM